MICIGNLNESLWVFLVLSLFLKKEKIQYICGFFNNIKVPLNELMKNTYRAV